jgi:hypothetical protein
MNCYDPAGDPLVNSWAGGFSMPLGSGPQPLGGPWQTTLHGDLWLGIFHALEARLRRRALV